ncbi:Nucleotide-binding universal stress protein, UspA family [Cupriavidus sp. YR651]|uniref:universal stress protein n=1 Tax=Cupriavidus sp. YR651 TaxID=1855315 RepID=UPI000882266A|nr:universal stress protein [Cupriavidus sp. YR651]SDD85001.1 Nucleotide-binding universal stress protein, UspA family [Cupriavidus sp. YR651]
MYQTILVAVDGSDCGDLALAEAIRLAAVCKAKLEIVHVVDNSYLKYDMGYGNLGDLRSDLIKAGRKLLAQAQAQARAARVACHTELVDEILALGDIAMAINDAVQRVHADLVVVGTHGRRGVRRLVMGSVAQGLLCESKVPVLLVRAPGATASR